MDPLKFPAEGGENVTRIWHRERGARVAGQVLVSVKAPVAVMLEILRLAFPAFVRLIVLAELEVPAP
jgi:hypothetical protein